MKIPEFKIHKTDHFNRFCAGLQLCMRQPKRKKSKIVDESPSSIDLLADPYILIAAGEYDEHLLKNLKPAIHYSRTWANMTNRGIKLFFRRIKYCWRKRDEHVALHCSLFAVNFSCGRRFFFDEKVLCVRRWDCYPDANPAYGVRRKTCSQNMANAFYRLFAVRRFFVVSPLFRCCSRIVYSRL